MTTHAFQQAARTGTVDGPLKGYHREWYVVRPAGDLVDLGRVKIGEPREGIPWFDRRYFASEDELLMQLSRLDVPRVPPVRRIEPPGLVIHGFIEGQPLSDLAPAGMVVEEHYLGQVMAVFDKLARVPFETVTGLKIRTVDKHATNMRQGNSADFLQNLIHFTREQVYEAQRPEFGYLFDQLGVPATVLGPDSWLMSEAAQLSSRPFCLLHGDLHRANFIIDPADRLWTIDWELATPGDPLYDLATHLHLMNYPADQEQEAKERWCRIMADALPGAAAGIDSDLPRYLAYKVAQSVFTDVVRHAIAVRRCTSREDLSDHLQRTAKTIEGVLARAGEYLKLDAVPSFGLIESAYADFCSAGRRR
jgi:aminoglycoside phosphotransferase (APT) family kinase protein